METVFNKLVRDNIPDIISKNGEVAVTRVLSNEEYRKELYKKLIEECNEVINAKDKVAILEELGDVLEVIRAIAEFEDKTISDIISIADDKKKERGGFSKRIFLEKKHTK